MPRSILARRFLLGAILFAAALLLYILSGCVSFTLTRGLSPTRALNVSVGSTMLIVGTWPPASIRSTFSWHSFWSENAWRPYHVRLTLPPNRYHSLAIPLWPLPFFTLLWFLYCAGALRVARRPAAGHCRTCGYDLQGLPAAACPECGTLDPLPPTAVPPRRPTRLILAGAILLLASFGFYEAAHRHMDLSRSTPTSGNSLQLESAALAFGWGQPLTSPGAATRWSFSSTWYGAAIDGAWRPYHRASYYHAIVVPLWPVLFAAAGFFAYTLGAYRAQRPRPAAPVSPPAPPNTSGDQSPATLPFPCPTLNIPSSPSPPPPPSPPSSPPASSTTGSP